MSAYIIDKHLTNIINNDLLWNSFSDSAKIASIRSIFKKGERTEKGNYRRISILNCFSKFYERFLHNQIAFFFKWTFIRFHLCLHKRIQYKSCFDKLVEKWKTTLYKNLFIGPVLMDLSKSFDCIPHNLLIAKLHAYGRSFDTVTFLNSYLKDRKRNVRINY